MKKKLFILFTIFILLSSCYIDSTPDNNINTSLSAKIKLPTNVYKAPTEGTSEFEVIIVKEDDSEIIKTITLNNNNVFSENAGNGDNSGFPCSCYY